MRFTREVEAEIQLSYDDLAYEIAASSDSEIGEFLDILIRRLRYYLDHKQRYDKIIREISTSLTDESIEFINDLAEHLHKSGKTGTAEFDN